MEGSIWLCFFLEQHLYSTVFRYKNQSEILLSMFLNHGKMPRKRGDWFSCNDECSWWQILANHGLEIDSQESAGSIHGNKSIVDLLFTTGAFKSSKFDFQWKESYFAIGWISTFMIQNNEICSAQFSGHKGVFQICNFQVCLQPIPQQIFF